MFTFDVPPEQYFRGRFALLTSFPAKVDKILAHGIEEIAWLPFNQELATLAAEDFITEFLVKQLAARHVVCGFNFRFGRGREGDGAYLKKMGARYGYEVSEVGPRHGLCRRNNQQHRHTPPHCRRKLEQASRYLGHYPAYLGKVVYGEGRGRLLGFPTANLEINPLLLLPAEGSISLGAFLKTTWESPRWPPSVKTPTFAGRVQTIEAYILDFDGGDLYHRELEIQFLQRLRGASVNMILPRNYKTDRRGHLSRQAALGRISLPRRANCVTIAIGNPLLGKAHLRRFSWEAEFYKILEVLF